MIVNLTLTLGFLGLIFLLAGLLALVEETIDRHRRLKEQADWRAWDRACFHDDFLVGEVWLADTDNLAGRGKA